MRLKELGCENVGWMYVMCSYERGNECSDSMKGGEFLE
jgi:hypothetical protein